ncbi:MAG: hypothetical protein CMJ48_04875 [Planctomycetaceae bacterium]|nr:hypothetical protein [Planctomycetaceae bacterium]
MILLRRHRFLLAALVLLAGLSGSVYACYRSIYPFGWNHCCDKQLYFALVNYADGHGKNFPAGEATPQASLSLIHAGHSHGYAQLLCGKTGSESATRKVLARGTLLDPDTCGWQYVEGLRSDDDSRLALFWDDEGLGHNGERLSDGGHVVMFVGGSSKHIPATQWDAFLAEQEILFAKRRNALERP